MSKRNCLVMQIPCKKHYKPKQTWQHAQYNSFKSHVNVYMVWIKYCYFTNIFKKYVQIQKRYLAVWEVNWNLSTWQSWRSHTKICKGKRKLLKACQTTFLNQTLIPKQYEWTLIRFQNIRDFGIEKTQIKCYQKSSWKARHNL
jgi:hypothetical protein